MTKAVIYTRVSSKEQEREGYSIAAQLDLLRNYAVTNSITVLKEFEDVETAKQAGRTNFINMLQFLKNNKEVKSILVEKTDRLYRNFKDYVLIDESEYEMHLVKENTILSRNSRSHEKFIHGIKVLMAKNYIDNLSEEVKKGLKKKAEQGYCTGKPPFGYVKQDKKYSIPQPEQAKFIKRAFELYAKGDLSLKKTAQKLYKEGFIYKENRPKVTIGQLEHILKNPFYYGMVKFKDYLFEGKHEPLITKERFDRVQLAFKKDNKPKYENEHNFLFAGMLTCLECGCVITAEIKKGKYIYYHCTGGKGECSQKKQYIREEAIEKQLIQAIKKITVSEKQEKWIIEVLKESFKDEQAYVEERLRSLTTQKQQVKDRLGKIYLDKIDGVISEEFWLEKHNEWTDQHKTLQSLIESHENASINYMEEGVKVLSLCKNAYNLYFYGDKEDKKQQLKYLLSNSYMKDGKVQYEYKKPFDFFAKGLNCIKKLPR